MDFLTFDINEDCSIASFDKCNNDLSSTYEFNDSVSTLFNEKATQLLLESISEQSVEKSKPKKVFHINKTKKKNTKLHLKFFICEECGKIYRSKENTVLHYKNVHLKQKPYVCKYCDCGFSHRSGKIYHEREFHTKIFPYECPYGEECSCRFPTKSSLKYHLKSKHKESYK